MVGWKYFIRKHRVSFKLMAKILEILSQVGRLFVNFVREQCLYEILDEVSVSLDSYFKTYIIKIHGFMFAKETMD